MLKINPNPTFKVAVSLTVPGGDLAEVQVVYRHKPRAAVDDWLKRVEAKVGSNSHEDAALLAEVIAGIEDLQHNGGEAVTFSVDALATVLENYPASGMEFVRSYVRAMAESRAKN